MKLSLTKCQKCGANTKNRMSPRPLLSTILLIAFVALNGCATLPTSITSNSAIASNSTTKNKNGNHQIIYLLDSSQSADQPSFQAQITAVCQGLMGNIQRGDSFTQIPVSAESYHYNSPTEVSPNLLRQNCGKRTISGKKGTITEPAFDKALKSMGEGHKIPLLLIHIQSNETEKKDPVEKWRRTVQKATAQGGSVLVVGSTNDGNEDFNFLLVEAFDGLKNVFFVSTPTEIEQGLRTAMKR